MEPEKTQTIETPQPEIETPVVPEQAPVATEVQSVTPVVKPIVVVKKAPRQRHFLAAFFISFMWGTFGADRMYMGYWGLGFLKLITLGGFGLWVIVDLILIMGGYMRDKQGREMLQVAEYKKFAARTVLIFAIVLGIIVLINGIALILGIAQLMDSLQNGSLPGLNGLNGGELPPDLQQELNL
ncbi:MAG: TM2 domain-containing protein [Candidatus Microsaccharimonas sp.]